MTRTTGIEWTESTWNPLAGCSLMSPGCTNCYAMKIAYRLSSNPAMRGKYSGLAKRGGKKDGRAKPVWTGVVRVLEDQLEKPLRRKKPTIYFTNSMSDLFHPNLAFADVARIWAAMAVADQHVYQVLTKRPDRMVEWLTNPNTPAQVDAAMKAYRPNARLKVWPLPHVWLGTSVEDQTRANERIPVLLKAPAAVRFLSVEPLLGPVSLSDAIGRRKSLAALGLHWVITGGESGPGARPMHPSWAKSLRDECIAGDARFFFKQVGSWAWSKSAPKVMRLSSKEIGLMPNGTQVDPGTPGSQHMIRGNKKTAGKLLDGRVWQEMPDHHINKVRNRAA